MPSDVKAIAGDEVLMETVMAELMDDGLGTKKHA